MENEQKQPNTTVEPIKPESIVPGPLLTVLEGAASSTAIQKDIPQNSGEIVEKPLKDEKTGKFVPGHEKVGGKKAGTRNFSTLIRDHMKTLAKTKDGEEVPLDVAVIRMLTRKAIEGNLKAMEILMDRTDGKPVQRNAMTDTDGNDLIADVETKAKVREALDRFINKTKA